MTAVLMGSRGSSHPSKTEKHDRDNQNGIDFSHGLRLLHILSSTIHDGCLFSTFYSNSKNLAAPRHLRRYISPFGAQSLGRPWSHAEPGNSLPPTQPRVAILRCL